MIRYFNFFPQKKADQAKWFINYVQNLPDIAAALGTTPEDIAAKIAKVRVQQALAADADQKTIDKLNAKKLQNANLDALLEQIKQDVDHMKTNPNWTPEMSAKLQTDNIRVRKDLSSIQPDVTVTQVGNSAQIGYTKNGASGAHIYRKMGAETVMTMIARCTDSSFTDPVPLQTTGGPDLRQYQVVLLDKDNETGLPSKVITIVLGA